MPRLLCFAAAGLLAAGVSLAQARQSTLDMSCGQAAALVGSQRGIVLSTGQHTYDRFVSSPGFCRHDEYGDTAWVPTRDGLCRIGYTCRQGPPPWNLFDN